MKPALKIAYIGKDFHGSQFQPGIRTVEGELKKALIELGIIPEKKKIYMSGRTDAGVNALCQVVTFDPENEKLVEPRIINSKLPKDIWVYGKAEVQDDFDPRRDAESREYRYVLYAPRLDDKKIIESSKFFLGRHDFSNFAHVEPGKNPERTIKKLDVLRKDDTLIIDIEADSFLWNMVRKIVNALTLIGSEEKPVEWINDMLSPETYREGLKNSPPEGLYLMNINYNDVDFIEDDYSKKLVYGRLAPTFLQYYTMSAIYREFMVSMKK